MNERRIQDLQIAEAYYRERLDATRAQLAASEARAVRLEVENAEMRATVISRFSLTSDWQCAFCLAYAPDARESVRHHEHCPAAAILAQPAEARGAAILEALRAVLDFIGKHPEHDFVMERPGQPDDQIFKQQDLLSTVLGEALARGGE